MGWKEKKDENLRMDLCTILKEKSGVVLGPNDVLEIHRLSQGNSGGIPNTSLSSTIVEVAER